MAAQSINENAMPSAVNASAQDQRGLAGSHSTRRRFLQSSVGALAGTAAAQVVPSASTGAAFAQGVGTVDAELARVLGRRRILIKGGVVLTLDRQVGDFAQADVLIEDGRIREVRPDITVSFDSTAVVDATSRVVIPGFIDTHNHTYQGLLRSALSNGLLNPDYNRDVQNVLTPAYAATDAYAGVLLSALGMIDMGTTGIVDLSQVSHSPEHSDACIQALQDSGIRAVFAYHRGAGPAAQYPQDIKRLQRTYFASQDQLLTLALTLNLNASSFALAREVGVPAVLHIVGNDLSEQFMEIGRAGLLRPGDEYIHCIGINDAAWRMIKDTGGRVSICAAIDMAMGHGLPMIQEALDHGLRLSLSSDHGVTIAQDAFTIMRSTFTFQRMQILQRAHNGVQNLPPLLTCRDVLEFATIDGARCANLDEKVGTLTPGKEADIVLLKADRLDVWPLNNVPGTVVNLMNPAHVETVFIAGRVKKWRGSLVGVDTARVLQLARESRDAVLRRAGYTVNFLS